MTRDDLLKEIEDARDKAYAAGRRLLGDHGEMLGQVVDSARLSVVEDTVVTLIVLVDGLARATANLVGAALADPFVGGAMNEDEAVLEATRNYWDQVAEKIKST